MAAKLAQGRGAPAETVKGAAMYIEARAAMHRPPRRQQAGENRLAYGREEEGGGTSADEIDWATLHSIERDLDRNETGGAGRPQR